MIEALIFDFDGVILDSTGIKDAAYRKIFQGYDENTKRFMEYHQINGGISRFVKIRYFFEELLQQEVSKERVMELAGQFGAMMREELTNPAHMIKESVEFIKNNHQKYPIHVASGAEEEELKFICEKLGIKEFFVSIHGSPTIKPLLVEKIIKENGYNPLNLILIGDSINDYQAANQNNIEFYGYNNPSLKEVTKNYIETFTSFVV